MRARRVPDQIDGQSRQSPHSTNRLSARSSGSQSVQTAHTSAIQSCGTAAAGSKSSPQQRVDPSLVQQRDGESRDGGEAAAASDSAMLPQCCASCAAHNARTARRVTVCASDADAGCERRRAHYPRKTVKDRRKPHAMAVHQGLAPISRTGVSVRPAAGMTSRTPKYRASERAPGALGGAGAGRTAGPRSFFTVFGALSSAVKPSSGVIKPGSPLRKR